jgi:flavin reductase (DIM6/NTAB) family NADH-FMN oxidoreductase RutF/DNA-binding transcriptional LysR family regulator
MSEMVNPAHRQRFLEAMSYAASTVSVVTTDGPKGRAGVTVSAMASVSADTPVPSLLVCVHHLSPAAAAILGNGVFCVNVLRDDQSHISDSFAGRLKTADGDKFSCAGWTRQTTGAPRVVDPLVAFDCRLSQHSRIGTHYVFIGEALDIFVEPRGNPLIYANRAYGRPARLDHGLAPVQGAQQGETEKSLGVGCYQPFAPYLIPALFEGLVAEVPDVRIRLLEGNQGQITEALKAGTCEIALTYRQEFDADLAAERLTAAGPYVLLPEGHGLAANSSLSLADLAPLPLILLDAPPSGGYFLSLFKERGLTPNIRFRSASFETVRGLVGHGLGYSLLTTKPSNRTTYDGRALVVRQLGDAVEPSEIVLAYRKGRVFSPVASLFANLCRQFFGQDQSPI